MSAPFTLNDNSGHRCGGKAIAAAQDKQLSMSRAFFKFLIEEHQSPESQKRLIDMIFWPKSFTGLSLFLSVFAFHVPLIHAEKAIFAYPSPSTSFLPLVVAHKKGFFDAENLQAELVQIRPAVSVPGLTNGSVDYATVLGSTIAARMRGAPLVIIGVFADKPMDFLVGGKGITSPKELKGRVVGISALGSTTHFLTVRVLRAIGLDPDKDVTLRAVGDEGLRLQALGTGLVQAALLGSQGVIQGDKEGLKMIVAAADVIDSLAFAGLSTTLAKVKDNAQQIKRVMRAGLKGIRYVLDNKAGTVDVLQSWYRLDQGIAAASYDLAVKSYSQNGEVSEKGISLSMEFVRMSSKIEKEITPTEMVDFNLLREARKELGWPSAALK